MKPQPRNTYLASTGRADVIIRGRGGGMLDCAWEATRRGRRSTIVQHAGRWLHTITTAPAATTATYRA